MNGVLSDFQRFKQISFLLLFSLFCCPVPVLKSYFIARVNVDKYFLISYLLVINGSIFMFVYRMYVELTAEDTCTSEDLSKDEFSCLAVSSHSFVMIKKSISSSVLKKP